MAVVWKNNWKNKVYHLFWPGGYIYWRMSVSIIQVYKNEFVQLQTIIELLICLNMYKNQNKILLFFTTICNYSKYFIIIFLLYIYIGACQFPLYKFIKMNLYSFKKIIELLICLNMYKNQKKIFAIIADCSEKNAAFFSDVFVVSFLFYNYD